MAEAPDPGSDDPASGLVTRHGMSTSQTEADLDLNLPVEDPGAIDASTKASGPFGELDFPAKECRLVLLGKTGSGKSSTGNTLLEKPLFKVGESWSSITSCTQANSTSMFGIHVKVVDTPGVYDTERSQDETLNEICKCIAFATPGPHALLFVVRSDVRFTKDEKDALQIIREQFGENIMNHVVIVFTHCDKDTQKKFIENNFKEAPDDLKAVLNDVNRRYVMFDNKASNKKRHAQARKLLTLIRDMLKDTGEAHFSNELMQRLDGRLWKTGMKIAKLLGLSENDDKVRQLVLICVQDVEKDAVELQHKLEACVNDLQEVKSCASQEKSDFKKKLAELEQKISEQRVIKEAAIKEQEDLQAKLDKAKTDLDNADKDKTMVQNSIEQYQKELAEKRSKELNASETIKYNNKHVRMSQKKLQSTKLESEEREAELKKCIEKLNADLEKTKKELHGSCCCIL